MLLLAWVEGGEENGRVGEKTDFEINLHTQLYHGILIVHCATLPH